MNIFTFTKLARVMLLSAVMVAAMVGTAAAQQKGTFKDSRDGKTYKTVVIGGKKWMAENLNYKTGNSWCNGDDDSNCEKYGRLYDWKTAKTACPKGWHLSTRKEWVQLAKAAGGTGDYGEGASKKLKSTYGWDENGNGTDEFGFSALPGGARYSSEGSFDRTGWSGLWWTDSEDGYFRSMGFDVDFVNELNGVLLDGYSVRCVAD